MQNETGKHYVSLDTDKFTCYPEEKEILLQAGLTAKLKGYKEEIAYDETIHIFDLYISESMVYWQRKLNLSMFIIPFIIYFSINAIPSLV